MRGLDQTFFFLPRQINIKKVLVSGGSLDHRVAPQVLKEGGAEKVSILALNEAGRVSEPSEGSHQFSLYL